MSKRYTGKVIEARSDSTGEYRLYRRTWSDGIIWWFAQKRTGKTTWVALAISEHEARVRETYAR